MHILETRRITGSRYGEPDAQDVVYIASADRYCMIMPRDPNTDIYDSRVLGETKTYCSTYGRYDNGQGKFPDSFWRDVAFKKGKSSRGGRFVQLTGCIRPERLTRLNPKDVGGQYDSSGGFDGRGNPKGSVCLGYKHYVEMVEPNARRACIKCCDNYYDCPLDKEMLGCPEIVEGDYFDCA